MKRKQLRIALFLCFALVALTLFGCGSGDQASESSASSDENEVSEEVLEVESELLSTAINVAGEEVSLEPVGTKNILVIGDDAWEEYTPGHADLMCVLHVDFDNHEIVEVSITRETRYPKGDGHDMKLNYVYTERGGAQALARAVTEVTGLPVDFYVCVGLEDLVAIVDHFGGVEVNLPYSTEYYFYTRDYPNEVYDEGEQTLDGWRAMALARSRTGYTEQGLRFPEMTRQYVDRIMLTQLMQEAYSYSDGIPALFDLLSQYVDTDLPISTLASWAEALGEDGTITVKGTTGPYSTSIDDDNGSMWFVDSDPEGWANMVEAVQGHGDLEAAFYTYETSDLDDRISPVTTTEIHVG